jgi:hypothetical protein
MIFTPWFFDKIKRYYLRLQKVGDVEDRTGHGHQIDPFP